MMAELPMFLIPGFLVPVFILTHIAVFVRLARAENARGAVANAAVRSERERRPELVRAQGCEEP